MGMNYVHILHATLFLQVLMAVTTKTFKEMLCSFLVRLSCTRSLRRWIFLHVSKLFGVWPVSCFYFKKCERNRGERARGQNGPKKGECKSGEIIIIKSGC